MTFVSNRYNLFILEENMHEQHKIYFTFTDAS